MQEPNCGSHSSGRGQISECSTDCKVRELKKHKKKRKFKIDLHVTNFINSNVRSEGRDKIPSCLNNGLHFVRLFTFFVNLKQNFAYTV